MVDMKPRLFRISIFLLLTIDTFLSFFIICFVLWSGWIKELSEWGAYMWFGATQQKKIRSLE